MGGGTIVLFGAFDRHNFGDLLFAHLTAALLPNRPLHFAGLAQRDLRRWGGHQVEPLTVILRRLRDQPHDIVHVGGEILTCTAEEAAVMLLEQEQADRLLAQPCPAIPPLPAPNRRIPYVASPSNCPGARTVFNAVGGVGLECVEAQARDEVLEAMRAASWIGVRDALTHGLLEAQGIAARLMPDSAVMLDVLFGHHIRGRGASGEVAQIRKHFSSGYLAVQCSADFGDDATLAVLADQLDAFAGPRDLAIVLFRAGAAPWHDTLETCHRLAHRLQVPVRVFGSLDVWEICALIAASRAYCGSSLHGRIVALCYALPRISLIRPAAQLPGKHGAFCATWDQEQPGGIAPENVAQALEQACAAPAPVLEKTAAGLAQECSEALAELRAALA